MLQLLSLYANIKNRDQQFPRLQSSAMQKYHLKKTRSLTFDRLNLDKDRKHCLL